MQPVRIGMNAAVVLLLLLLSVPIQLLLSNLVATSTVEEGSERDIADTRTDAIEQLVTAAESVFGSLHSTVTYYSKWSHLKELVIVPYWKPSRAKLKSTSFKSKVGTTTILYSTTDGAKTSKTSQTGSQSGGTGQTSNAGSGSTANPARQAVVKPQLHTPEKNTKVNSSPVTVKPKKQQINPKIEEVSRAKEVEEYLMNEVYFGQSKTPRERRRSSVKFSVGQIVKHKDAGYVGVIIGWDEVAKAPDTWIQNYYSKRKDVEITTHYLVLIDSMYSASGSPYHYIPQEDIEQGPLQQLRCPEISKYFEGFQNGRHIPKPWLRNRYPQD